MNELFIQENYISQNVEHVRVRSVPSGKNIQLEKHAWGCKCDNHYMYGHVQIKTLLGYTVDEHKGIYAGKNLTYDIDFGNFLHPIPDVLPLVSIQGFYYHAVTEMLWVQCYRLEYTTTSGTLPVYVPYIRVFHILPGEPTMMLRTFDISGHVKDEHEMYITHGTNTELATPFHYHNYSGVMVDVIKGAVMELDPLENTFLLPIITKQRFKLNRTLNDDYPILIIDGRTALHLDSELAKESVDIEIQYRNNRTCSFSQPIAHFDNVILPTDAVVEPAQCNENLIDMLLIHHVKHVSHCE
jgi:hypothetical protein